MLLIELANEVFGIGCSRQQFRKQIVIFLGVMVAVEEAIEIGEQSVEDTEVRLLAAIDLLDELVETVEYRAEVFMFTFDDGNCAHSDPIFCLAWFSGLIADLNIVIWRAV